MTVEPSDSETTMLIKRVDVPPPPYAQPVDGGAPSAPPPYAQPANAGAPSAPPPYAQPVERGPDAPPPYAQPASNGAPSAPLPPPQTMADAMRAISMPPLAPPPDAPVPSADGGAVALITAPAPVPMPVPETAPAASVTTTTATAMPPPASEVITCPECGTTAQVTLNRRDSIDFCRVCDYPLFWTPSKVVRDPSGSTDESLRRLPGTVGRATIASLACPFCAEPNALSAQTCVRCQRPMHPVVEAPAPVPIYVPPPPPVVLPEPKERVSWWVWALLAFGAAALITLIVLIATHTIN